MTTSDIYVLAQRLHHDGRLYEVGETIAASAFNAENLAKSPNPKTPEQQIEELRAAGVLKLPIELQQAIDVQAALAAKQTEIEALQAQLAELQAQQTVLPATVAQKKGATGKGADMAPAGESAPLSE